MPPLENGDDEEDGGNETPPLHHILVQEDPPCDDEGEEIMGEEKELFSGEGEDTEIPPDSRPVAVITRSGRGVEHPGGDAASESQESGTPPSPDVTLGSAEEPRRSPRIAALKSPPIPRGGNMEGSSPAEGCGSEVLPTGPGVGDDREALNQSTAPVAPETKGLSSEVEMARPGTGDVEESHGSECTNQETSPMEPNPMEPRNPEPLGKFPMVRERGS